MSAAYAQPRTGFKFMLIVQRGPDKGASYQLLPPTVSIGRGPDNNVALTDPKVSRQAALIELTMERIVIRDISSRQSLSVNGNSQTETDLKDGDTLRIGDSEMIFAVEALPLNSPLSLPSSPTRPTALPEAGFIRPVRMTSSTMSSSSSASASASTSGGNGKLRFYIILGGVALLLVWLLTSQPAQRRTDPGLRTVEEIEKDIKGSEERQQAIVKKRMFKNEEERTRFDEANRHYLEGFRDYQKGQYTRALRSFETARAIDPEHELARRYYKLAEKQRDEMIALLTLEGRRYKEKHMFARCSSAFEKVLDAIPNKDDLKYKQVEALKRECDLLIGDKFR